METTDLITDIIQGIEDTYDTKGKHTCEQGEYQVVIRWDNDNVIVADVTRNGWPWRLPLHINKDLLFSVVREKVKEVEHRLYEDEENYQRKKEDESQRRLVNWFSSMADH